MMSRQTGTGRNPARPRVLMLLVMLAGMLGGCADPDDPASTDPVIHSISASVEDIVLAASILVSAHVGVPAGDSLSWVWSCTRGSFPEGNTGQAVEWLAPDTPGPARLTLLVEGENGSHTKFLDLEVEESPGTLEMIRIPAGSFLMGQDLPDTEGHAVALTREFQLARTELTNQQFLTALNWAHTQGLLTISGDFVQQYGQNLLMIDYDYNELEIHYDTDAETFVLNMGTLDVNAGPGYAYPAGYEPADHPAIFMSWFGAACCCDWLSLMHGLEPYYKGEWDRIPSTNNPYEANGYRLPTEAEWEFAARSGGGRYPWGNAAPNCERTNFVVSGFCVGWSRPVASYPQGVTSLGLHDMAGNVWEWCNDWYATAPVVPATDPVGPAQDATRVIRGGSWFSTPPELDLAFRFTANPGLVSDRIGMRICRTLP